jgi:hypothetical protein
VLTRVLATCQQRKRSVPFNGQQPALAGAACLSAFRLLSKACATHQAKRKPHRSR